MGTSTLTTGATSVADTLGRRIAGRRHRTIEEKRAIVAESFASGASVAEVARRYEVNANQVFAWRRLQQQGLLELRSRRIKGRRLVPVKLIDVAATLPAAATAASSLVIELPSGVRVSVSGTPDVALLTQALSVLLR